MQTLSSPSPSSSLLSPISSPAFSLVEVLLALGICSFVLIALLALFTIGLHDSRESGEKIEAANLASLILSARRASPLGTNGTMATLAIPPTALARSFGDAYAGADKYVALDGTLTTPAKAAFRIRCSAGTNAVMGADVALVHLFLSWPPQMAPSQPNVKSYEFISAIPLR
ncbi:Verru_Chthon cassette protein B [Verrucomicrobium sp. GAS474]|uniref:type IV pilus modification PilV family protein n=1 Tax=Verrucomicrobium sp. GAS474 TaxID=1882831 RepID=UPI00087A4D9B|nr:hypothetical protein [Verrucomicrobium sp. GAS474]SDT88581.1 Verru_Chthon cassette protein B [Verrucomicrobium sp. GAS474]